jgi:hypothetical protein
MDIVTYQYVSRSGLLRKCAIGPEKHGFGPENRKFAEPGGIGQRSRLLDRGAKRQMVAAFRGEQQGEFISFASIELLRKVLTAKRWEILSAMTGEGALSIREVAAGSTGV